MNMNQHHMPYNHNHYTLTSVDFATRASLLPPFVAAVARFLDRPRASGIFSVPPYTVDHSDIFQNFFRPLTTVFSAVRSVDGAGRAIF